LTIFAAGNLVLAADAGLHGWTLNSFLSFKSRNDCDRRRSRYYGAAFQLFVSFTALVALLLVALFGLISPSKVFGFSAEPGFDAAFAIMTLGMVFTLPLNLASALYRARGLYGRIIGVMVTGSLLVVVIAYVAGQIATLIYVLFIDVQRLFPFIKNFRQRISRRLDHWTICWRVSLCRYEFWRGRSDLSFSFDDWNLCFGSHRHRPVGTDAQYHRPTQGAVYSDNAAAGG
jgi:hypothetical protein